MVYFAIAGPSVSVMGPSKPQSLLSVPGGHCTAYVVAVASWCLLAWSWGDFSQRCAYRANDGCNKRLIVDAWDVEDAGCCLGGRKCRQGKADEAGGCEMHGLLS